jgi:hypothetical protein
MSASEAPSGIGSFFEAQGKRTFVGRKLETTSLRLDTGALAARLREILSAAEPFEPAG